MTKKERKAFEEKLITAVKKILKANETVLTAKIEKFVKKSVQRIVKKSKVTAKKKNVITAK